MVIASKRIIDGLFHSKATDIFMVFMHRCNIFGLSLKLKKKSKEDLRHEFEAMEKESEMARAKQAEEIEKIKKGITRNHVLPSSNAWS